MDNVNYNFKIIEKLVNSAIEGTDKRYYCKPIYLLLAAIIECTLYDFLKKINEHRYEQVPNLTKKEVKAIQDMKKVPNKLNCFNNICKKHSFLGEDEAIYDQINEAAEIRNRIHIQNEKGHSPMDESDLWEINTIKKCGQLLKDIFVIMCEKYPRPDGFHDNPTLDEFPEPWTKL
ncbi:Uncharacterised protein [Legionella israelensis]|uniref:DUF4145 domain-containing protein n=2 Tax=Legionella israelensis TaxID=454 RepID=A0A0W0V1J5_9GAMM|nr:hypothetical protein [Legionella israelensis]KTD13985.1 hypothetical protein Lisr_2761 [Legionella israelensis]SCY25530.1 hypothetical protein SAMN02746069_01794 [Legionella israelensis DSM 19235]STX60575.1 Uncharacterised protein [Legionella israelensis]